MLSKSQQARLNFQHDAIDEMLVHTPPEKISKEIQAGKWSIQENIAHLSRYQEIFIERIHLILTGKLPAFARYSAEEDPEFANTRIKSYPDLMQDLKKNRQEIIGLLRTLPDQELKKTGSHPVMGSLELTEWIEFFLLHEAHHMMTIYKLAHAK
jgi:uncharacterized damage-inducible protein DinB